MGQYYRKGTECELARASEDFEIMRGAVDRLGALIADAKQPFPGGFLEGCRAGEVVPYRPCIASLSLTELLCPSDFFRSKTSLSA